MNVMRARAIIVVVLLLVLGGLFLTGIAESHVRYSETRVGVRSQNFTPDFKKVAPQNPEYVSFEQFLTDNFTSSTLVIQKEFDSTHLAYFGARYYDPTSGRFTTQDPVWGLIHDPRTFQRYSYGHSNPYVYVDEYGEAATVTGGVLGFAWGFGQMIGGMADDLITGRYRSTREYLGVWAQNTVAGIELGASIDVALLSGGTAVFAGSGALGAAGFDALTVGGRSNESLRDFGKSQLTSAGLGAVGGVALSRVTPALASMAKHIPGAHYIENYAMKAVSKIAGKATALDSEVMAGLSKEGLKESVQHTQAVIKTLTAPRPPPISTPTSNMVRSAQPRIGSGAEILEGEGWANVLSTRNVSNAGRQSIAELAAKRHQQWAGDIGSINETIEALGQRALRNSGGDWVQAERLFRQHLRGVEGRLRAVGSNLGIEWQPAAIPGKGRVPAFRQFWSKGKKHIFATKDSRRLDAGLVDLNTPGPLHQLRSGYDITLDVRKPSIQQYYQEAFGNIPILDIR